MMFKKIYIEITNNCNLNCDFCIKNTRKKEDISIEKFQLLISKLDNYTKYLYFHILGEPLIHPKINDLIDLASKSFYINITTNGYLIKRIKDNKNIRQINISLHSFSERYNMSIDSYLDNVFNCVEELIDNGTYVSLRMWVKNKYNDYMINYINNRYNVEFKQQMNNFTIKDKLFINNFQEFIWPDLDNNYYNEVGKCYALKDHIGILVDGTVIPCCLDTKGIINLGNIYNDSLDEIMNQPRVKRMLKGFKNRKKCEELCKHCKFIE